MEKDIYSKIEKIKEQRGLSTAEKEFHRGEILKFVERRPSPFYLYFLSGKNLALHSLAMIFVFGAVAISADNSLPNDFLYRIKTNINEPILLFFTPTSQGKAAMKVELVNKRLQEFSQVTLNKKLNQKDKAKFVNHLSLQIKDTQSEILKLAEKKNIPEALEATNDLQSILSSQETIFGKIHTANPEAHNTDKFSSVIDENMEETSRVKNQITEVVETEDNEEALDQAINNEKEKIINSINNIKNIKQDFLENMDHFNLISQNYIDRRIARLSSNMEKADDKLKNGEKQEALELYNQIDERLGELESLIETGKKLNLEKAD